MAGKQIESSVLVVTPENVAFEYQVAGPFRRLSAFVLDLAIRIGTFVACLILIGLIGRPFAGFSFSAIQLIFFVFDWFYGGLFETYWNGQTPGKRLTGLRVLSTNGEPINGLQAILRNIIRGADIMPAVPIIAFGFDEVPWAIPTGVFGLVACSMSPKYQRLGDLVAGTIVVVDERPWLVGVAKFEDRKAIELASEIPASFEATRDLGQALSAYVERRKYFSQARQHEIARHIAVPFIEKYHLPPDTNYDSLMLALYYRAFVADQGTNWQSETGSPAEAAASA